LPVLVQCTLKLCVLPENSKNLLLVTYCMFTKLLLYNQCDASLVCAVYVTMKSYVESKLIGIHRASFTYRFREKCATLCTGVVLSLILPYLHIGMYHIVESL